MSEPQAQEPLFGKFDESNFKSYDGGCHCGKVKYNVSISPPIEEGVVMSCNCSICHMNGYLNVYAPDAKLKFLPDREAAMKEMTAYGFGQGRVTHYFCKTCGSSIFGRPTQKHMAILGDIWCINARSLHNMELEKFKLRPGDGKNQW